MKELKTLKDLEIAGHDVVREEAVKWVKANRISFLSWVEFFNITEEELLNSTNESQISSKEDLE